MTTRFYSLIEDILVENTPTWKEDETEDRKSTQHDDGVIVIGQTTLTDKDLEEGMKKIEGGFWRLRERIITFKLFHNFRQEYRRRHNVGFPVGACIRLLARRATLVLSRTFVLSSTDIRPYRQLSVSKLLLITILSLPLLLVGMVLAYGGVPSTYQAVRLHERQLPQHEWTRGTIMEVRHGGGRSVDVQQENGARYIRFPDHLWGHGLNNVLQEALLQSLIAYHTNRSYVFEDFVWSHLPLPYTLYDFSLRPTRVPMGAFLGGWITGEHDETSVGSIDGAGEGRKEQQAVGSQQSGPLMGYGTDRGNDPSTLSTMPTEGRSASPATTISSYGHSPDPNLPVKKGFSHNNSTINFQSDDIPGMNKSTFSVSAEYFEYVCPPSQSIEVVYKWPWDSLSENEDSPSEDADGLDILRWWMTRLSQDDLKDKRCVVVREEARKVWDANFFGTRRPLSLFPLLRDSPILDSFKWSNIVTVAVERSLNSQFRNTQSSTNISYSKKLTGDALESEQGFDLTKSSQVTSSAGIVPGLVAIHLRRGDYKRHCTRLAHWKSGYMGWNRLVDGLDGTKTFDESLAAYLTSADADAAMGGSQVDRSEYGTGENDSDVLQDAANATDVEKQNSRRKEFYLAHCLPTIAQVVRRLRQVKEEYAIRRTAEIAETGTFSSSSSSPLTQVYVLTNGWPSFLENLRQALLADEWEKVFGSVDLEDGQFGLSREEKGVGAAIDMGIAEQAEVFLGNGFSSLTANVVLLRLAKGLPEYSNQLL